MAGALLALVRALGTRGGRPTRDLANIASRAATGENLLASTKSGIVIRQDQLFFNNFSKQALDLNSIE